MRKLLSDWLAFGKAVLRHYVAVSGGVVFTVLLIPGWASLWDSFPATIPKPSALAYLPLGLGLLTAVFLAWRDLYLQVAATSRPRTPPGFAMTHSLSRGRARVSGPPGGIFSKAFQPVVLPALPDTLLVKVWRTNGQALDGLTFTIFFEGLIYTSGLWVESGASIDPTKPPSVKVVSTSHDSVAVTPEPGCQCVNLTVEIGSNGAHPTQLLVS